MSFEFINEMGLVYEIKGIKHLENGAQIGYIDHDASGNSFNGLAFLCTCRKDGTWVIEKHVNSVRNIKHLIDTLN